MKFRVAEGAVFCALLCGTLGAHASSLTVLKPSPEVAQAKPQDSSSGNQISGLSQLNDDSLPNILAGLGIMGAIMIRRRT